MKLFSFLLVAFGLWRTTNAVNKITLDCTTFPESCNNDCYGIFTAKQPSELIWDKPSRSLERTRRSNSGCRYSKTRNSVCSSKDGVTPWNKYGDSCDEYPYASTKQGGKAGATLRCISQSDNSKEGRFLQTHLYNVPHSEGGCENKAPCKFNVLFKSTSLKNSHLCMNKKVPNDGHEFKLVSKGKYTSAKRDEDSNDIYTSHASANLSTFPMHMRREFVLSSGDYVMLGSTDMEVDMVNETVATANGPNRIVRELFGHEKSEALRPPVGSAQSFLA